jgi:hypothetical protein
MQLQGGMAWCVTARSGSRYGNNMRWIVAVMVSKVKSSTAADKGVTPPCRAGGSGGAKKPAAGGGRAKAKTAAVAGAAAAALEVPGTSAAAVSAAAAASAALAGIQKGAKRQRTLDEMIPGGQ